MVASTTSDAEGRAAVRRLTGSEVQARAHWAPTVKSLFNAGFRYQANSQFGSIAVPEFGGRRQASVGRSAGG
ncbi:MAG: hypothetical protein ABSF23_10945 [Terracidiphilus sp.]